MHNLIFLGLLVCWAGPAFSHPNLEPFHQLFPSNELHAGFGLARDLVAHAYQGKPFAPRDYDFAVIGSDWTEQRAIQELSKYGRVVRTLTMGREIQHPNGVVWNVEYGFVIILDHHGQQIDFKFFRNLEDAHFRGIFDVEKILFPMRGQSLERLQQQIVQLAESGLRPGPEIVSDPFNGIEAILTRSPRTINWPKALANPIEWAIRGAMIHAKLESPGLPADEIEHMRTAIHRTRYVWHTDHALIERAIRHRQWWRVRDLLHQMSFFERFKQLRWQEVSRRKVDRWLAETPDRPSCHRVFF